MLCHLSNELIIEIIGCLHYLQLVRCRRVCKKILLIVDRTPLLQYAIELGAAGYEMPAESGVQGGIIDRLNRFRDNQRAYRNPAPKLVGKVELKTSAPLLRKMVWQSFQWRVVGSMLVGCTTDQKSLGFLSLRLDTRKEDRFRALSLDFAIHDYEVYPSQDLVIIREARTLQFKSIKTGEVHDRVKFQKDASGSGTIVLDANLGEIRFCKFSCSGDWLLACNYLSDEHRCRLYHWPSGQLRKVWHALESKQAYPQSGCLLETFILIPSIFPKTLQPCIDVFSLPSEDTRDDPKHLASYLFPKPSVSERWEISVVVPNVACADGKLAGTSKLLQITLRTSIVLYIQVDKILTESVRDRAVFLDTHVEIVQWPSWSATHARLLDPRGVDTPVGTVGLHLIYPHGIMDFNRYDLLRDIYAPAVAHGRRLRSTGENYSGAIHDASTIIPHFTGFQGEISTSLPYRKMEMFVTKLNWRDKLCFIEDENGPMLIKLTSLIGGRPSSMHFFTI